ncbi:site-specific integrase [Clostridium sp. CX1]|uniref:site-specific integrase n=1 Tax=Clostridium sp. CX1 TaxID=2978346 RepID=UPI0021BFAEFB|nr:site-specific integrase [Clostridium sp. CX1]MCT8978269.1 site-specific integrase [Clostridium sp. CX1]
MRGSIRKRGATYQIRVDLGKDPLTGKRKEKSMSGFKGKKEAEKALAILIADIEKGEYFEADKMTLKDYLYYWLETYAKVNVATSTFIRYKEFCNHIIKHIGNLILDKIKPANIQKFYSTLLSSGKLSSGTILKIHRMFHQALKHAVNWEIINTNPTEYVTAPKANKTQMTVWEPELANKFMNGVRNTNAFIPVMLALTTGMRAGEISALKWSNINFDNEFISITHNMQRVENGYELKQPKTDKSRRTIAMMDMTVKELKEHRKKQLALKLYMGPDYKDEDFVCAWDNGSPFRPHYISDIFRDNVKKLKFPKIRFHDLRHTHATIMLSKGVHAKVVSERLGHSNISITLDTYSHVLPNMQKEAVSKINDVFEKRA